MRVIIAGSRNIKITQSEFNTIIDNICETNNFKITEVISGCAKGADTFGEMYGYENQLKIIFFPALWKDLSVEKKIIATKIQKIERTDRFGITRVTEREYQYNKLAGFVRNEQMGNYANILIAIWDGKSKGTEHMITYMKKLNKPVFVHILTGE
jgi:hypothetical protein